MDVQEKCSSEFVDGQMLEEDEMEVWEPKIGMIFNSVLVALKYYHSYAKRNGFGATITSSRRNDDGVKSRVTLGCHRNGKYKRKTLNPLKPHPTTECDCKVSVNISLQIGGEWMLNSFFLDHNHDLSAEMAKYIRSNRTLPEHAKMTIERNRSAGIRMNKIVRSCVLEAGGHDNLMWFEKDAWNYADQVRRSELKEWDAQAMVKYFERMQMDNRGFYYVIDVDEENRLRNVFWADARSIESYKVFGDVVTFDTTYLVNQNQMPFAPFVGVNHHGQSILFGCGLVTQEDTASFVWLFKAWLSCMGDRFTDHVGLCKMR